MWSVVNSKAHGWNVIERLCFPAPRTSYDIRSFPEELILVPREDGLKVPCLFLPFKHARFLILYFHGNAEDLGLCYTFCTIIRDLFQVHILAVEYPGYGICQGPCSDSGIMANALAAMRFVTETLHWSCDDIKLLGRSLGTGPTVALATMYDVAGVILVSPFLSIREIFRCQVGAVAGFITERFPNHELAGKILSPTLIIHGQQDALIPLQHGKQIYDSVPAKKMMVCPAQMSHNTSLLVNVGTFVLPMTQFFSLPDYTFEDIEVPEWAFPDSNMDESIPPLPPAASWSCGQDMLSPRGMKQYEDAAAAATNSRSNGSSVGLPSGLQIVSQPVMSSQDQAAGMVQPPNMTPRLSPAGGPKFEGDALSASRAYSFRSPPPTPRPPGDIRGSHGGTGVAGGDSQVAVKDSEMTGVEPSTGMHDTCQDEDSDSGFSL